MQRISYSSCKNTCAGVLLKPQRQDKIIDLRVKCLYFHKKLIPLKSSLILELSIISPIAYILLALSNNFLYFPKRWQNAPYKSYGLKNFLCFRMKPELTYCSIYLEPFEKFLILSSPKFEKRSLHPPQKKFVIFSQKNALTFWDECWPSQ